MPANNTLLSPIVQAALTLGSVTTLIRQDCRMTALGLYNSHNAIVNVIVKDGNGFVILAEDIDAGATKWYDWADMTNGFGFYFAGGLVLVCSVANKVNAFPAGYTA